MAKTPDSSPINTGLVIGVIKSFLGDFSIEVDRVDQVVTFQVKSQRYKYTYDQLIDELEKMFNDGQPEKQG